MGIGQNTAKIVDFNAFKQQREQASPAPATVLPAAPFMMWYPVWVFVPQPFPTLN